MAEVCFPLAVSDWRPTPSDTVKMQAIEALEVGKLLYLPQLPFTLTAEEKTYLRPDCVDPKVKSVKFSYDTKTIWGASEKEKNSPVLFRLLTRYAESARDLVNALLPEYSNALTMGNTSFRPVEAEGRIQSARHDDRRLHVDAFPSRPNAGERILRVFTNINPEGQDRIWRVGEKFEAAAKQYLPRIPPPLPGSAQILKFLHITKGLRTRYDHYMLQLHDRMKLDAQYQSAAPQTVVPLAAGASWIVFTDQVLHAAMQGRHAMEQTFTLPVSAMHNPEMSPLRTLERLQGERLAG